MVSGIEGMGEAVTGGMLARAVEPEAGEAQAQTGTHCLNCGTALVGEYCHHCGQTSHIHRTVAAWWHDFLHSVLHLDGKFWRTLPMLAWRPGDLTRRYIAGERARFISPLAIFLFSVFLMFAVLSLSGATVLGVGNSGEASRDLAAELAGIRSQESRIEAERQRLAAHGADTGGQDEQLSELRQESRQLSVAGSLIEKRPVTLHTGWAPLDEGMKKASANPALLFYKLQTNAYKFSWALIPISVPFLWLLFLHRARYRREYKAYDHLVFVTYSIAFMSLALVALFLLQAIGIGGGLIGLAFLVIVPVHMYRQLKGAYSLSRASALWRTGVLLIFAAIALSLFLLLLFAIGVLG